MKPSPYFADTFRYFFFRFRSKESVAKWFVKRAGTESEAFEYPFRFDRKGELFVILPELHENLLPYIDFLKAVEKLSFKLVILANSRHREFLEKLGLKAEKFFATGVEMRYGEPSFHEIESKLRTKKFAASLYLEPKPIFQLLYLAKVSGAPYRFGFDSEKFYPLLNLSLVAKGDPKRQAELLTELFQNSR